MVTTVFTVNSVNTFLFVYTASNIKGQLELLNSCRGNIFTNILQPIYQQTNRPTTRLLELLGAAKNINSRFRRYRWNFCIKKIYKGACLFVKIGYTQVEAYRPYPSSGARTYPKLKF